VDEDIYWIINFWYSLNCVFHLIYLLSIKTQKMNFTNKEWHINIHHAWEQWDYYKPSSINLETILCGQLANGFSL